MGWLPRRTWGSALSSSSWRGRRWLMGRAARGPSFRPARPQVALPLGWRCHRPSLCYSGSDYGVVGSGGTQGEHRHGCLSCVTPKVRSSSLFGHLTGISSDFQTGHPSQLSPTLGAKANFWRAPDPRGFRYHSRSRLASTRAQYRPQVSLIWERLDGGTRLFLGRSEAANEAEVLHAAGVTHMHRVAADAQDLGRTLSCVSTLLGRAHPKRPIETHLKTCVSKRGPSHASPGNPGNFPNVVW